MRHVVGGYCAIRKWSFGRRRLLWILILTFLICIPIYNSPNLFAEHSAVDGTGRISGVVGRQTLTSRIGGKDDRNSASEYKIESQLREKVVSKREADDGLEIGNFVSDASKQNKVTRVVLRAVHLAVVACGERIEEPLMMLKSAVIFGRKPIHLHVFTDEALWSKFSESLRHWERAVTWRSFSYTLYPTSFPQDKADEWRKLFKLCASQRLFIPNLLTSTDALLYVDTDVLFLRPPEDLWSYFDFFNETQIAGLSPETEDASTNWYIRFARHPFYKPLGVNSGVMLMNLTRMRNFHWRDYLSPILMKYRYNITWGDQDIINIIFSAHPDKLFVFGCEWNYRPDHCMYGSTCEDAENYGASVLHGSRGYFHTDKQPAFKVIFEAVKKYKFGSDLKSNLFEPLHEALLSISNTTCGALYRVFMKQIKSYVIKDAQGLP